MNFQHIIPEHKLDILRGTVQQRLQRWRSNGKRRICGPYTFRYDADSEGFAFYLESDFAPDLRWDWADEISSINHNGWYSDEFGDAELIRGIVLRLPHGRGFLAGWSMGEHMITEVERCIYEDIEDAARAADSLAEYAAERQREHEAEFQADPEVA